MCYSKSTPYPVSEKKWDAKQHKGKSMMGALYIHCSMPKSTSQAEAMSNSEKSSPIALVVVELHLSEGIRQLVSQSISRKFCLKKNNLILPRHHEGIVRLVLE